jgi:hypothetical protein
LSEPVLGGTDIINYGKEEELVIFPESSQTISLNIGGLEDIFSLRASHGFVIG